MDTHITTAPDIDDRIGAPLGSPICLPGRRETLPHSEEQEPESLGESAGGPEPGEVSIGEPREKLVANTQRPARRTGLLSTAAVVVVLAGTGGVVWAERQGAVNLPLPSKLVAIVRTGMPSTTQVTGEVGVAPSRSQVTAPASPRPNPDLAALAARQQAEFASLKPGDTVAEVGVPPTNRPTFSPMPAAQPSAVSAAVTPPISPTLQATTAEVRAPADPAPTQTVAPVTPPAPPSPSNTVPTPAPVPAMASPALAAPAVTAPAPPVASPTPVPAPKPRDPAQVTAELRAEPMSPKQQVEVVGLVRELGAQLKESRLTIAQLQATVAELKEQLDTRMTEFDGRLGLAEAGTVLAQSAKAAVPQPIMAVAAVPVRPGVGAPRSAATTPSTPPVVAAANRSVKDFRVQGASPGLAVLNVVGAASGEAPVLYVSLGDQVPGIGRIKSIYQRGTSWVVQTDAGLIQ